MFAICPPGAPANAPFRGVPVLGTAAPGSGCGQDSNSNFVGEVCDSNENWSRPALGSRPEEEEEEGCSRSKTTANPSHNLLLLMQRQMVQGRLRDTPAPSPGAALPRLPEPGVRSPPEGAEVGGAGGQNAAAEGCHKLPGSPMEDNGYASSSLSIDSPDSACGGAWDPPTTAPRPESPPQPGEPELEVGTLFPALVEAVQHLQDKERFKEREKEKHHIQLVMYRRLALLRWIHGLQQKVVDQQNRLQESFDTILDNRKELIRCMQHGPPCPAGTAAPSP
ncbi:CA216 protein, partial [Thinocorus orbignyianus]|nr:CA216 protein [Thinocorus orbignyianus]